MRVCVQNGDSSATLRAQLAVEKAPRLTQMHGGCHSDDGIFDARPLVYGVPLPLNERRDDTVWGTRMPVLQGWIELLDTFGYVYYHNMNNLMNSWLPPGGGSAGCGNIWNIQFYTLEDGSESWIHPEARRLGNLTINTVTSESSQLLPSRPTSSDTASSAGSNTETSVSVHTAADEFRNGALLASSSEATEGERTVAPKLVEEGEILTDMRWTNLDNVFCRRLYTGVATEGHSLTSIHQGRSLLKFGGSSAGQQRINDLYALDVQDLLWRPIQASGAAPVPRTAHGSVSFSGGSRMLVFGGASRQGRLNDLHMLDTECWKWTTVFPTSDVGPNPRARLGMTQMSNGTSAVVFGGREGYRYLGDRYYNDVWVFDAYRAEWLNVLPHSPRKDPAPRSGCVVEMVNGRQMVLHAGYDDGDRFYDDTWLLDTVSWSWQQVPYPGEPHRPSPREGHASTMLGDTMFIYGGDRESGGYLSDIHMFDSNSLRWAGEPVISGATPGGRVGAAISAIDNHRLLLSGGDNGFSMATETHMLDTTYTAKAEVKHATERIRQHGPHASSCIICLEGPVEAAFLWCGHFVCCRVCASRVRNICPLCRSWISKVTLVN